MPPTLGEAIATEPMWLQAWLNVLGVVQLAGVLFVVGRVDGRWRVRLEPIAVLASLVAAVVLMGWLYGQVGYVRLLGLAHLVCWTPVYVWFLRRRVDVGTGSLFGKWINAYLVVVGISLSIDVVDLIRYFLGDGELLHRWSQAVG